MSETPWRVKKNVEKFRINLATIITAINHPLEEVKKFEASWLKKSETKAVEKEISYDFQDPLGATGDQNELDEPVTVEEIKPRSHSLDNTLEQKHVYRTGFDIELPDFQPWRNRRAKISNLTRPKEFCLTPAEITRAKVKALLEASPNSENSKKRAVKSVQQLSQEFSKIRDNLSRLWLKGERVECFKKVVEVVELLQTIHADSNEFAYSWLQAIDILDHFGTLVYDRLFEKANETRIQTRQTELPVSFNSDHIPQNIKDVATNWFIKVSELDDIIPRFYVETSMIRCLRFLDSSKMKINLERLASMCSTFPTDQFSMFARVYISRIAMHIDPTDRSPHWRLLHDWLQAPKDILSIGIPRNLDKIARQKQNLVIQTISWIVQCVSYGSHTIDDLAPLWAYCRKKPIDEKIFILVAACIEGMPSKYLAVHSTEILEMIYSLEDDYETPLITLGRRYSEYPPVESDRDMVKKSVWLRIANISDFEKFLNCSIQWSIFICKYYTQKDVGKIIEMEMMRLERDERSKDEEYAEKIVELMAAFLENTEDTIAMLKNSNFITLLELTPTSATKFLEILKKKFKRSEVDDLSVSNLIIDQCVILGKSLPFDVTDESSLSENLIAETLTILDLKSRKDKMKSVELLVKIRAELGLRQKIVEKVVYLLIDLTLDSSMNLKSGSKKSEFLRICITNLAVTIPAIHEPTKRFRNMMKNAQLCILANFLPQLDSTTRKCIATLELMTETMSAAEILPYLSQFLASLILIPDPPQKTQLYYFDKIWRFLQSHKESWSKEPKSLAEMFINCLRYLCATRRSVHSSENASNITANDVLYAGDLEFGAHVDQCIDNVMAKLLAFANDPMIALSILENIVFLFEIHEEIRSTLRGLLKRAYVSDKTKRRLDFVIKDLRSLAQNDEAVMQILQKLSLI